MVRNRFHSTARRALLCACALGAGVVASAAHAGEADVVDARLVRAGDGTYSLAVTVRHADEGWDHYADRWDVFTPEGELIASRVLAHPHVNEQPFTRSLAGVTIPQVVLEVVIRAHDSVHGLGGAEVHITVPD